MEEHNESLKKNINILKSSIHNKKVKIEDMKTGIIKYEANFNALQNVLAEKKSHAETQKKQKNKLKVQFESKVSDLSMITNTIQEKK